MDDIVYYGLIEYMDVRIGFRLYRVYKKLIIDKDIKKVAKYFDEIPSLRKNRNVKHWLFDNIVFYSVKNIDPHVLTWETLTSLPKEKCQFMPLISGFRFCDTFVRSIKEKAPSIESLNAKIDKWSNGIWMQIFYCVIFTTIRLYTKIISYTRVWQYIWKLSVVKGSSLYFQN